MQKPIAVRLDRIDRRLSSLSNIEEKLERVVKQEDKEIEEIEKEERAIERNLLKLGNFTIKRSHLLELARGTAGAFLGVGLGQALGSNVALLIYKNDKGFIQDTRKDPLNYILGKISTLYAISLAVELIGLVLFNNFPGWNTLLVKALLVGSYPAMSSAAAFSII
jgi:hypothetical protein